MKDVSVKILENILEIISNINFDFTDFLLSIIAIAVSIIAIKITFSFDINEFLKDRNEKLKGKIKNYCTHVEIKERNDEIYVQSSFISPSGTTNWICQKCGTQLYILDKESEDSRVRYFIENPKKLKKQEEKFQKLMKKAGFL